MERIIISWSWSGAGAELEREMVGAAHLWFHSTKIAVSKKTTISLLECTTKYLVVDPTEILTGT